jgi:hypothetical protein
MREGSGPGSAEDPVSAPPSRREFLTTVTLAAASAALPGCATLASTQRAEKIEGLAPSGCRARYCRHFATDPQLAEGVGRCLLSTRE